MVNHPLLFFYQNVVSLTSFQKHIGMFLYSMLNFRENLKTIFEKTNKTIGLICKFQTLLPRAPLIRAYKLFIRPHLDYDKMIFDQSFNMSF